MLPRSNPRFRDFEITYAYLRDVTYVAANMRDADWEELSCLLPPDWNRHMAALYCLESGIDHYNFVAKVGGQPIAAFGFSPITPNYNVRSAWMFGTDLMPRYVNLIGAFMTTQVVPEMVLLGLSRIEARALDSGDVIHSFFKNMGSMQSVPLVDFGGPGKDFRLYSWNVSQTHQRHARVRDKYYRFVERHPIVRDGKAWYFKRNTEGANSDVSVSTKTT